jgi:mono/diheme cytochrome c family protein
MKLNRLLVLLTPALLALFPLGCGRVEAPVDRPPSLIAAAARYAVRTDLMAIGDLGAPPKWPSAGYLPLDSLRLGQKSPDPEFISLLEPKLKARRPVILDPLAVPANHRDIIGQKLEDYFGTPASPKVRVPTAEDAKRINLEYYLSPKEIKEALAEGAAAKAALPLDAAGLARGGILYRRWCMQCHGPSGGGNGEQAIALAAPPRDYRKGLFKFVTCFPTGVPSKGELGKARIDDLKRTIRNGLDGSMMPPFPQFSDEQLNDLAGYVMHLSIRGEAEFEMIHRTLFPKDIDPDFNAEFAEQVLVLKLLEAISNWKKAGDSPIPVPPENTTTELDRLASAARGYKGFTATCAGCHQDYGRAPQLKFDLWGTVVQPRNLMLGVYRGGRRGEDLYARIYGGIYPSTMPDSKAKAAADPDPSKPDGIWDIVHFLQALPDPAQRKQLQQFDPSIKIE